MTGFDLSPVQATALACLVSHCNEVPCVDDVECDLGFSTSAVQSILTILERKGYIQLDNSNTSVSCRPVTLTEKAFNISQAAHSSCRHTTRVVRPCGVQRI